MCKKRDNSIKTSKNLAILGNKKRGLGKKMRTILVAEDDFDIRELLQNYLENEGYQVILAADGEEALEQFHQVQANLVILDLMMPKMDGYCVCEAIREESSVPIILLTALDSERNQLKGFELKIDDYITKPFSIPILLCKIEAVLRRTGGTDRTSSLIYRELSLDLEAYRVFVGDRQVELTRKEFELLRTLLQNQGRVLTRQTLLNRVWSYDFYGEERIVDTHIKNLRKKLEVDYIETIRGVGYRIDKEIKK